jgi:Tfp pilus assembly protein PilN
MSPLNLAARPFRNERLPTLILALGLLLLAGLSVRHVLAARDLAPGRGSDVEREVAELERETARLREASRELSRLLPETTAVKEWDKVRELVDRRAFSWTALFAALEEVVPPGIRLVSIAPEEADGGMRLAVLARGGSAEDGLAFLEALQQRADFQGAFLTSASDGADGSDFSYLVRYVPAGAGARP